MVPFKDPYDRIYVCFIDLKAAFDTCSRDRILVELLASKFPIDCIVTATAKLVTSASNTKGLAPKSLNKGSDPQAVKQLHRTFGQTNDRNILW